MKSLELHLDGTSPDKLSMRRLSVYLRHLAELYGEDDAVHFDKVAEGCACLQARVEEDHYDRVLNRTREAARGMASVKANRAYQDLVAVMQDDRVDGSLHNHEGAQIIQFPRARNIAPPMVIFKYTTVQGRIYMVGGKDDTIPVRLEGPDGETLLCEATVAMAEELAGLMFKNVRLSGKGSWARHAERGWSLRKLKIDAYELLELTTLRTAIDRLQAVGGNRWDDKTDPHAEILALRG